MRGTAERVMAEVLSVRDAAPDVREIRIGLDPGGAGQGRVGPGGMGPGAAQPGAHVDVDLLIGGRAATRTYSLLPEPAGAYRIGVKRADPGRGGSAAMWRLAPGDRLRVTRPGNRFELQTGRPAYLLVAGGIGITPLVGMAAQLARAGARVRMLYAARDRAALAFLDELEALPGLDLACFADAEGARPDLATEIAALPAGAQAYTCGPMGLLDAMRRAWRDAGRPVPDLRYETFGDSGTYPTERFELVSADTGISVTVAREETMLDALARAGVEVISDCRRGECGLCAVDVLDHDAPLDHRDVFLSEAQKAGGRRICACVSRASGGRLVIDTGCRSPRTGG